MLSLRAIWFRSELVLNEMKKRALRSDPPAGHHPGIIRQEQRAEKDVET
jgi:hypothetical protein